jgi:HD-GYP domain-containing protein (c-di-GMP phosphodiesterase class II)
MEKTYPAHKLKVGMYILLPLSWTEHPFLKNQFQLTSQDQIKKIIAYGIKEVRVDLDRSNFVDDAPPLAAAPAPDPPAPKSLAPQIKAAQEKLQEVIFDKTLPPVTKAKQVHDYSGEMIKDLLDNPSAENIQATKQAVKDVVDLILDDMETSQHLMMITSHDYYTYTHSVHVGFLAVCLARNLFRHSNAHNLHELGAGFFLHDLGKVGISLDIINKPGKLTDEEMQVMKRHPSQGFAILKKTKQITEESRIIVLQHHERFDGTGYPQGIRGSDIHIYGKICAIADVYDALTTDRPYRNKLLPVEGLKIMKEQMMNHFQKDLFEQFVLMIAGQKQ